MQECIVLYDAACDSCARFKRALGFFDAYRRSCLKSLKQADEEGMLAGVSPPMRFRSFHIVFLGGRVRSGAKALPYLVGLFPLGGVAAKLIRVAPFSKLLGFTCVVVPRQHENGSRGLQICCNDASPDLSLRPDRS